MAKRVRNRDRNRKMSNKISLTAIVSLYNSGQWLRNRIENLLRTNIYRRNELLIYCVNASSSDPNDDAIPNEYSGIPNFHYEIIPQCTVYAAWNHAIKRVDTEFITNANADDIVSPDCYDILISACKDSSLAYCGWYTVGIANMKWEEVKGTWENVTIYNPTANHHSCGHFPLWKRSIHDRVGLFDPSFKAIGDADLWWRCWVNNIRDFNPVDMPLGAYLWRFGSNLWHRTDEDTRKREWQTISSRQPGKLEF